MTMTVIDSFAPSLRDIRFKDFEWDLLHDFETAKSWRTQERDNVRLRFFSKGPVWNFDLTDIAAAKVFYMDQVQQHGGAIVEISKDNFDSLEVLKAIFKYRSPIENHAGMYYVGKVWIPFKGFMYQLSIESLERIGAGSREVVIAEMYAGEQGVNGFGYSMARDELLSKMGKCPVAERITDDCQYDSDFPDHPLTKIRRYFDTIKQSFIVSDELKSLTLYRL